MGRSSARSCNSEMPHLERRRNDSRHSTPREQLCNTDGKRRPSVAGRTVWPVSESPPAAERCRESRGGNCRTARQSLTANRSTSASLSPSSIPTLDKYEKGDAGSIALFTCGPITGEGHVRSITFSCEDVTKAPASRFCN